MSAENYEILKLYKCKKCGLLIIDDRNPWDIQIDLRLNEHDLEHTFDDIIKQLNEKVGCL